MWSDRALLPTRPVCPRVHFYSIIIIIITSRLADLLNTGGVLYYMAFLPMRSPQKNEKRETSRIEKLTTAIALRKKKSQLGVGCIGKLTLPGYHTKWYKKLQEGGEYRQRFRS